MAAPPRQQIAWAQKYGKQYGVDPKLLLAIGGFETRWGTLGAGRPSQGGYVLGYGRGTSRYSGPENQYRYAAQTLAGWGAKTLADLQAGKAAAWTPDSWWEQGVTGVYRGLGSMPSTPVPNLGGSGPTAPAGPPPSPGAPAAAPASVSVFPAAPAPLAAIPGHILDAVNRSLAGTLSPTLGGPVSPGPVKPLELAKFVPKLPPTLPPPMPLQPVTQQGVSKTRTPTTTAGSVPLTKAAPVAGYPLGVRGKLIGLPYQGTHTLYKNWESDRAVDIAAPVGTPVYAPFAGTIGSQIGALGGGDPRLAGLRVHVDGTGDSAYLAHLSRLAVKAGQHVKAGQLLGYSGSANGTAHLHFATKNRDPRTYTGR